MTKSSRAGKRTSATRSADAEILSVSPHGIWLTVRGTQHLLRYDEHPWFKDAKIGDIFDVRLLHDVHLWWPALDVDLHVDSLAHPERFPLQARRPSEQKRRRASR